MSMVDFRCAEYSDGKMVADKEIRKQIKEIGIRKVARETKVNRETVALIANGSPVKPNTLNKIVAFSPACARVCPLMDTPKIHAPKPDRRL